MVGYSEEVERGNPAGHFGVRLFPPLCGWTFETPCDVRVLVARPFPVGPGPAGRGPTSPKMAYVTGPVTQDRWPTRGRLLWPMPLDRELIGRVRALDEYDLRRLLIFAGGVLSARTGRQEDGVLPVPSGTPSVTYRQESVRCGKPGCTRCPHGPYWYAYWREGGRVRSRYLGKRSPLAEGDRRLRPPTEGQQPPDGPPPDGP
jgi:hypothetical protein